MSSRKGKTSNEQDYIRTLETHIEQLEDEIKDFKALLVMGQDTKRNKKELQELYQWNDKTYCFRTQ